MSATRLPRLRGADGSRWDAIVVGGGPAGAAAIALATAGCRALLVERSRFTRFKLGESLPPQGVAMVEQLLGRIDQAMESALGCTRSYGNLSAWGGAAPSASSFLFSPAGFGLRLDRPRFDRAPSASPSSKAVVCAQSNGVLNATASGH